MIGYIEMDSEVVAKAAQKVVDRIMLKRKEYRKKNTKTRWKRFFYNEENNILGWVDNC